MSKREKLQLMREGGEGGPPQVLASGLTVFSTVLFITGEITGSGVLALPGAFRDAGWVGVFLTFFCAAMSAFTGTMLGRCWTMLRENKPQETQNCGNPYPTIAFYAFGRPGRVIVNVSVYFTLYGVCVVLLLLASGNVQTLLHQVNVKISLCYWLLIIGGILTPFCWLKSPKDFWPIALGATLTTAVACVLMFAQMMLDIDKARNVTIQRLNRIRDGEAEAFDRGFESFFLAFGTILFCFGGMASFPTFQADMKEPKKFTQAVLIGFTLILLMYVPVAAAGFGVYGDLVEDNVSKSLSPGLLQVISIILITLHLVFAFVILQNPLSQALEKPLNLPDKFGWKRMLARTAITAWVIFTAESCPKFENILSLVGGSSITVNTFIFPSVFFWRLCRLHRKKWEGAYMPWHEIPFHIGILIIGVFGGISATYSAIRGIVDPEAFVPPCYVNISSASGFTEGKYR